LVDDLTSCGQSTGLPDVRKRRYRRRDVEGLELIIRLSSEEHSMLRSFRSLVLIAAFAPGALAAPLQSQSAAQTPPSRPSLFSPIAADASSLRRSPAAVSATARRTEYVALNLNALDDAAFKAAEEARDQRGQRPEFRLDLFGEVSLVAMIDSLTRSGDGRTVSWAGKFEGQPLSSVVISVTGLVAAGHFSTEDGGLYQMRFVSPGVFAVHDLDQSRFPVERQPIPVTLPEETQLSAVAPAGQTEPGKDVAKDDGSIIDVLIVYTPAAQAAAGGQTQIETEIELAITLTNQGYANSGVTQRLRLVRKEPISYTERTTTSDAFTHALQDITQTTDPHMTGIHALRNTYGADMVSLWIQDSAFCGLAWLMTSESSLFESSAFSVVAEGGCATSNYSFGHELGHNQGSNHDRANASGGGARSYSYGYCGPGFRTVMSYAGTGCSSRINYWSNPAVNAPGTSSPTGILSSLSNSADNRLSLNETRVTASNWRASISPISISVAAASQNEGHTGSTLMYFTVTLSSAPSSTVTASYTTSNGTAVAGSDYTARTGTLTFAAGQTTRQLIVTLTGDTTTEPNETFNVTLSSPVGASLGTSTAVGTITNDDAPTPSAQVSQYRLYSPITLEHLFTTDQNEYNVLGTRGWTQEGLGYKMLSSAGTFNGSFPVPFYRLYHDPSRQHHWTTDANEVTTLAERTDWTYEGIIGFILPTQVGSSIPLFRLVLGNPLIHLWTTDSNEKFVLTTQRGWGDEGIPGYVIP
jgi:hypothetical protein